MPEPELSKASLSRFRNFGCKALRFKGSGFKRFDLGFKGLELKGLGFEGLGFNVCTCLLVWLPSDTAWMELLVPWGFRV